MLMHYLQSNSITWYLTLFILGSVIGSFLNVVIYRLPIMLQQECEANAKEILNLPVDTQTTFNLVSPASHCPNCKCKVPWYFNIPIVGYLFNLGKCHNCQHKISLSYPLVETVTAILFAYAGYFTFNLGVFILIAYLIFISFSICLICIDFKHMILPDSLTLSLLWIGLLVNCHTHIAPNLKSAIYGSIIAYLILWCVYYIFKLLTKKEGLGFGDFKYFAALGAWFGYHAIIFILLGSSFIGLVYALFLFLLGKFKRNQHIPFGPFLGISGIIYLFYSHLLLDILYSITL